MPIISNFPNIYHNDSFLIFKHITIPTSAWISDSTYTGWSYKADILLAGITEEHIPFVTFDAIDASSGNFAPVSDSHSGGIYIYAKNIPSDNLQIVNIVCLKGD